jgi:hypothetical protein
MAKKIVWTKRADTKFNSIIEYWNKNGTERDPELC